MKRINVTNFDANEAFFHFTKRENLEAIEQQGLIATIGDASKMVGEKDARVYMSKGKGILGINNSFIYEFKRLRICDIPTDYRQYFDISDFSNTQQISEEDVYSAIERKLKNEVYLKVDAVEGEDYKNEEAYGLGSQYDIKGKANHNIEPQKLSIIETASGDTAFDVLLFYYTRLMERASKEGEENIIREFNSDLDAFFKFVEQRHKKVDFYSQIVEKQLSKPLNTSKIPGYKDIKQLIKEQPKQEER